MSMASMMAAIALMSAASEKENPVSPEVRHAALNMAQCLGISSVDAKKFSDALKVYESLPEGEVTVTENVIVIQPAETVCNVVKEVVAVTFQRNKTPFAMMSMKNDKGTRVIFLMVYLGPSKDGQHTFMASFRPEDSERVALVHR